MIKFVNSYYPKLYFFSKGEEVYHYPIIPLWDSLRLMRYVESEIDENPFSINIGSIIEKALSVSPPQDKEMSLKKLLNIYNRFGFEIYSINNKEIYLLGFSFSKPAEPVVYLQKEKWIVTYGKKFCLLLSFLCKKL